MLEQTDIDDILEIGELNRDVLVQVAERISRSSSWEQLIYRESEIDQIWRLIDRNDPNLSIADPLLEDLRANIMAVHDLVGVDHDPTAAAQKLSTLLSSHP